jgi:hypothetical protein
MVNYEDYNYAYQRLVGTIVMYADRPVMVNNIDDEMIAHIKDLITGEGKYAKYDNDFDITPVPLGYCNIKKSAYYLSRSPMRKDWKQGLRAQTVRAVLSGLGHVPFEELPNSALGLTIMNVYPSFEEVVELVTKKKYHTIAFNRSFAVDENLNIWHKGVRKIGTIIDAATKAYTLSDDYFWAKETLEEALT